MSAQQDNELAVEDYWAAAVALALHGLGGKA